MASEIDTLLRLVPEHDDEVLAHLEKNPSIASAGDDTGYTLLHAACSYNKPNLVRALVNKYKVDPNVADEDGDTPLFYVEVESMAKEILALGADPAHRNKKDKLAVEKIGDEVDDLGEQGQLVVKLLENISPKSEQASAGAQMDVEPADVDVHAPPRLPEGLQISIGTMLEDESLAPDPQIKRKIEELAARDDLKTEAGQEELQKLVTEIVKGVKPELSDERETKRRAE